LPRLSWAARIYVGAVVAAGGLVILLGPFGGIAWPTLVVLAVLYLICEASPVPISPRKHTWSAGSPVILAAVVLLGPVGAAIVGATAAFNTRRDLHVVRRMFNGAMWALAAYCAASAYIAAGGYAGVPTSTSFPAIIVPFAVAAIALGLVNYVLVITVLWLTPAEGPSATRSGRQVLSAFVPDLGFAIVGLMMAALWRVVGPFSAVLVLVPLYVARWAVAQYVAQQEAHEATMAALCQAVETKDFYTRGHSERVSKASVMIAREIGFRSERIEAIRHAGMLHDIGKLGVPTTVLQKAGALTEEEFAAIQLHPMRGLEIVREIGFLDEALAGIMHHHERVDGKGYPLGLAGDEIPEFARVIGVADAFDSMTSARSYRGARPVEEALAELRKWSGAQFDPVMVDAFVAALSRERWQPPEPVAAPEGQSAPATTQDHDDPTAPLRVVTRRWPQESSEPSVPLHDQPPNPSRGDRPQGRR
jgi:putative nucleotidyltransferase with HDIG domain